MGISSILNIAKSGIFASQSALTTISHNVSNTDTEGYSRQEAVLETATPIPSSTGLLGNGVTVAQVKSHRDEFLESRIIDKNSDLEYQETVSSSFQQIEGILSEENTSLSEYMTSFYNAWSELSTDPTSQSARTSLAAAADDLCQTIRNIYSDLKGTQIEANNSVKQTVEDINSLTTRIADLNQKIFESGGASTANDYVDERTQLLKELAGKLDIQTLEGDNGMVTVGMSRGKTLVDGNISYNLQATVDEETGFYDVSWEGRSGELTDVTSQITSGSLKGYMDVRDTYTTEFIQDIDELAQGLMENVNYYHSQGTNLNGTSVDFFQTATENYAMNIDLSDEVKSSVKNIAAGSEAGSTGSAGGNNDVALKIASLGEEDVIFGRASSSSFASDPDNQDDTLGLGISGKLVLNGTAVDIEADDTIRDIAAKCSAVTGITASVVGDAATGYQLVLQPDGRSSVTVSDGSVSGDNTLDSSSNLLKTLGFTSGGLTFTSCIADVESRVGNYTKNAADSAEYESSTLEALKSQRESVSGVSLDEELANLIKYQSAYQASAKLITTAAEMFQTLLEM